MQMVDHDTYMSKNFIKCEKKEENKSKFETIIACLSNKKKEIYVFRIGRIWGNKELQKIALGMDIMKVRLTG